MDYVFIKLKKELLELDTLWTKLEKEWEHPMDWEDLYKMYPLFITTATIARFYSRNKKGYNISTIKWSLKDNTDTSNYYYSDEKRFFNGQKELKPLCEIAGLFLHQTECVYIDTRKSDWRMTKNTQIYLYIKTDIICESCALANNGSFNNKWKNYRKTIGFVTYDDCLCGLYIEVRDYIDTISRLISDIENNKNLRI